MRQEIQYSSYERLSETREQLSPKEMFTETVSGLLLTPVCMSNTGQCQPSTRASWVETPRLHHSAAL
jgi:hypothetical protein